MTDALRNQLRKASVRHSLETEIEEIIAELDRYEKALREIHEGACRTAQDSRSRDDDRYCLARVIECAEEALRCE